MRYKTFTNAAFCIMLLSACSAQDMEPMMQSSHEITSDDSFRRSEDEALGIASKRLGTTRDASDLKIEYIS